MEDNVSWVKQTKTVDATDRDAVHAMEQNDGWQLISIGIGRNGQTTLTFGWPYNGE